MSASSKAVTKTHALARLLVTARDRPGESLAPDEVLDALGQGLRSVLGTLKAVPTRIPGKYHTKVFAGLPGQGRPLYKMLNALDFTVNRADTMKTYSGVRLEINGKITYVTYAAISGIVVVSSNASSIDI